MTNDENLKQTPLEKWREEHPREAIVYEKYGQLVMDDPIGFAVWRAVQKHNCCNTFAANAERVAYFKQRLTDLGMTAAQAVIVVLNVDDVHGGPLADILMPGFNSQEIRDRGEVPFVRGLAMREGIQEALDIFDKDASEKLRRSDVVVVVVVDHGVAEIFPA